MDYLHSAALPSQGAHLEEVHVVPAAWARKAPQAHVVVQAADDAVPARRLPGVAQASCRPPRVRHLQHRPGPQTSWRVCGTRCGLAAFPWWYDMPAHVGRLITILPIGKVGLPGHIHAKAHTRSIGSHAVRMLEARSTQVTSNMQLTTRTAGDWSTGHLSWTPDRSCEGASEGTYRDAILPGVTHSPVVDGIDNVAPSLVQGVPHRHKLLLHSLPAFPTHADQLHSLSQ